MVLSGSRGCPKWHLSLNFHSFPPVDPVIEIGVSLLSPSRRIGGGTATPNSAPIWSALRVFDVILKIPCSFRGFVLGCHYGRLVWVVYWRFRDGFCPFSSEFYSLPSVGTPSCKLKKVGGIF